MKKSAVLTGLCLLLAGVAWLLYVWLEPMAPTPALPELGLPRPSDSGLSAEGAHPPTPLPVPIGTLPFNERDTLSVFVMEKDGSPVDGASVFDGGRVAVTDSRGVVDVPEATQVVVVAARGFVPRRQEVSGEDRDLGQVTLVLSQGITYHGFIQDPDGHPVPDLELVVHRGGIDRSKLNAVQRGLVDWGGIQGSGLSTTYRKRVTTDPSGRFQVDGLLPGRHVVLVDGGWVPVGSVAHGFDPETDNGAVFEVVRLYALVVFLDCPNAPPGGGASERLHPSRELPRGFGAPHFLDSLVRSRTVAILEEVLGSTPFWCTPFTGPTSDPRSRADVRFRRGGEDVIVSAPFLPLNAIDRNVIPTARIKGWPEGMGTIFVRSPFQPMLGRVGDDGLASALRPPQVLGDGRRVFHDVAPGDYMLGAFRAGDGGFLELDRVTVVSGAVLNVDLESPLELAGVRMTVLDAAGKPTGAWWLHVMQASQWVSGPGSGGETFIALEGGRSYTFHLHSLDSSLQGIKECQIPTEGSARLEFVLK